MNLIYSPLSAIDRTITACPQYDKYFPKPKSGKLTKKLVDANGGVEETVKQMISIVNRNYKEVEKAKHLVKGKTTYDTAKNIFDFLYKHVKYNLERGEILNTPAASYYFGQVKARQNPNDTDNWPVDCDDFSIFAASFLKSLGLSWSFRIASYDGVNYSHVYCVIPGKKEIIIDPVYWAFNKEKPYKKQKTYIGSKSNNLSGMEIYTQGVTGISGVGNAAVDRTIIELAGGSHFAGIGLGSSADDDIIEEIALKGYLTDTLYVAKNNPQSIAATYKNPQEFIGMLGRAISALNTKDEEDILNELARQEERMIAKGSHSLRGVSSSDDDWYLDEDYTGVEPELDGVAYHYQDDERYFSSLQGFFGSLGLFRKMRKKMRKRRTAKLAKKNPSKLKRIQKRWVKKDKRRVKRQKILKKAAKFFNKLNPVTIAARNGLRALIALNFFNIAGRLKTDKNARLKVISLFEKMGGKGAKVVKTINKGAKRKPLFKKNAKVAVSGLEGLGYVAAISAILKVAGGLFKKIMSWLKDRKEKKLAEKESKEAIQPDEPISPIDMPEDEYSEDIPIDFENEYDSEGNSEAETNKWGERFNKWGERVEKAEKFINNFSSRSPKFASRPNVPASRPNVPASRDNGYPANTRSFSTTQDTTNTPKASTTQDNIKKYGIIAGAIVAGSGLLYAVNNYANNKNSSSSKKVKPLEGIELK